MVLSSIGMCLRKKCSFGKSLVKKAAVVTMSAALFASTLPLNVFAAVDVKDYAAVPYESVASLSKSSKIEVTGTPNYKITYSEDGCNYVRVATKEGMWYISIGKNDIEELHAAVPRQRLTFYGTYGGNLEEKDTPILDIQDGAILMDKKVEDTSALLEKGKKSLESKAASAASSESTKKADPDVYISSSGTKYHRSRTCSNMKVPKKVKKSYATQNGYTACQKCY